MDQKNSRQGKLLTTKKVEGMKFPIREICSEELLEKYACSIRGGTSATQYAADHQDCNRKEVGGMDRWELDQGK